MADTVIHVEVTGADGAALQRFYADVLGWTFDTNNPGGYGLHRQGDLTAGVGASTNGPGQVTFYVHTADPEATLRKVEAAGVLIGAVMKATKGRADAKAVRELILSRLSS